MIDTSGIHSTIARARRRLKLQAALEAATLAAVAAFASAMAVVFAVRMRWVTEGTGLALLAAAGGIILLGAVIGGMRRFRATLVAMRIDRASGLSDRLGTAFEFERLLAAGGPAHLEPETRAMMEAAVRDGIAAVRRANVAAATPFRAPTDTRAAVAFGAIALVVAMLWWPHDDEIRYLPTAGVVTLDGQPLPDEQAARGTLLFENTVSKTTTRIELGLTGAFRWSHELHRGPFRVTYEPNPELCDLPDHTMPCAKGVVIPAFSILPNARGNGPNYLLHCAGHDCTLDIDIKRRIIEDPVDLDSDDVDYISELLDDLKRTAETDHDQSLMAFVKQVDDILTKAKKGELSKEELLEAMRKAEEKYQENADTHMEESLADLQDMGKELTKSPMTKELGKSLEKGDLEQAQKEIEKLAAKLEKGDMPEKQKQQLAKALEKASDKLQKRMQKRDQDLEKQIQKQQQAMKKLRRKLGQEKNEQKRQEMSRRLEQHKRELQKLQRKKEQQQKSQSQRQLKQLQRNMQQASKDMRSQDQKQQKQASQRMRDMARNTGKVDSDKRKIRTQKKVASQLTDLREAMRRAKRQGSRGPKDLFGKNRKNRDFGRRARGRKGSRGAWKPGQTGRGLAQNGQNPGGKGQKPGGDQWGDGHDPDLLGDPTGKGGHTKDESVSGQQGRGESKRETILAAAQKGFATRSYQQVYAAYKAIVEEVMQTEKVPSGYKYYVKRYFQKIKPHPMD